MLVSLTLKASFKLLDLNFYMVPGKKKKLHVVTSARHKIDFCATKVMTYGTRKH